MDKVKRKQITNKLSALKSIRYNIMLYKKSGEETWNDRAGLINVAGNKCISQMSIVSLGKCSELK